MKRFLSIIICFAMLFSLAACSGGYKLDDKQIKQDVLDCEYIDWFDYEMEKFDVVERVTDKEAGTETVTFTAELKNDFSEKTVSMDVVYVDGENGTKVISEAVVNEDKPNSFKLTADSLTQQIRLSLAIGYDAYTSSNGSAVYTYMFMESDTNNPAGYNSYITEGDYNVISYEADLENLSAKSQMYFEKTGELFKVTETVNFEYYFDTATNTWQIKSADVIASTAEKLTDGFELTNTAMVDGVIYNVKLTGINPDGTFTGTASDVAISETPLAVTRLCGANVVGRPQGKNQVWYFLVSEGKLSSIFTATGSLSPTVAE
ncbi:MAG: hypothetical protein II982_03140 [Clostridia bacterium]|nr:hypothetical protein [Clostridia bacterium]